jgi:putative ATP-dependent endonuclease of OLD family
MKLSRVCLKGFRNFKDAIINFNEKSLIIGANDVGKTNLIWALRLLLDKGLSEYDIEPNDADFYAYEDTYEFTIWIKFENVVEDCVVSKLKGKISDNDKLYLMYKGFRDVNTNAKTYQLFAGPSLKEMEEIEERFYRKVLNIRYISSRRDFYYYIKKEKNNLFQLSKQNRQEKEVKADDVLYSQIAEDLKNVDKKIPELSYIAKATDSINAELEKLSIHHKKQKIVFDATSSNIDNFISNVSIASKNNDKSLLIGGDGKLNQIYLSLWAARNEIAEENLQEVSIICIEEPEAHLHPHQQRKLAEYLNAIIKSQVIITTHSPQIVSEYSPNSIIRLFERGDGTLAASKGCSAIIGDAFLDFGYRMSIIPAEAFFADAVLLIEGPSEELFYRTLAKQLSIDLDRLNISILMVDGIGFATFVTILNSLEIEWVLRTDNDISKIPKKEKYRFAGLDRCISIYNKYYKADESLDALLAKNKIYKEFDSDNPEKRVFEAATEIVNELERFDMFLSKNDLENDLFNGPLKEGLVEYFKDFEEDEIVKRMQKRKATFMYEYLKLNKLKLAALAGDHITKPLTRCKEIIENFQK